MHRWMVVAAAGLAGVGVAGAGCRGDRSDKPPRQFFPDMDDAPKWKPQTKSEFFADSRTMRDDVPGAVPFGRASTVAMEGASAVGGWGELRERERADLLRDGSEVFLGVNAEGDFLMKMPVPVTRELILRGQDRYTIYCSACHGFTGDGKGMVGERWSYALPNYHDEKYKNPAERTGKDGYLFHVARNGVPGVDGLPLEADAPDVRLKKQSEMKMPGYGHALSVHDAWAVVAYLRVLQQTVPIDQVPEGDRAALEKARADAAAAGGANP